MTRRIALLAVAVFLPMTGLLAQHQVSLRDLTLVRNRTWAVDEFLEIRAGGLYAFPDSEDQTTFAEKSTTLDGHVYFRGKNFLSGKGRTDAYIGRDGWYLGVVEGDPKTAKNFWRFEFYGQNWMAYQREGFFDGDNFVPTGMFDKTKWDARVMAATSPTAGMKAEAGAFYGQRKFNRNEQTSPAYVIPENYNVYGLEIIVEENKIQVDQKTRLPFRGALFSAFLRTEWNDSKERFGLPGNQSTLPSQIIRGGLHAEILSPASQTATWMITGDAAMGPKDDRIWIYDPWKPEGRWFVDGKFELRWLMGDYFSLQPGFRLLYQRIADEFQTSEDDKIFWGGSVRFRWDPSENIAFVLDYSYLSSNERAPVKINEDSLTNHWVYAGFELRF